MMYYYLYMSDVLLRILITVTGSISVFPIMVRMIHGALPMWIQCEFIYRICIFLCYRAKRSRWIEKMGRERTRHHRLFDPDVLGRCNEVPPALVDLGDQGNQQVRMIDPFENFQDYSSQCYQWCMLHAMIVFRGSSNSPPVFPRHFWFPNQDAKWRHRVAHNQMGL